MNELQPQESRNACLDRGLLVSLRDGELTPDETEQALAHLAVCPDCVADQRSLATGSRELYGLLDALGPSSADLPETAAAFAALQSRLSGESRHGQGRAPASSGSAVRQLQAGKPKHLRRWWLAAAAAIVVAVMVLPHADALASQFLGLFQPQSFQPVSVNLQSFRSGIGENLGNFGEMSFNDANLKSIAHPTRAELQQDLNFKFLLPGHLPPGVGQAMQFSLIDGSSATFTFNAARARAYLQQTSQGSVSIPPELDGATFTITLAPGVIINYGKVCQSETQIVNWSSSDASGSIPGTVHSSQAAPGTSPSPAPSGAGQNGNGLTPGVADLGCSGGKPFYIGEIPSPVIRATGKASLEDLRSFILSLPKLSTGARLLLQDVNLSTGVVPLPIPSQLQAEQVTTHNARGVMVVDPSLSLGAVVWQTGGVVYMVAGATSDSTQLMDSANSLH
jgi:hypothetical protein